MTSTNPNHVAIIPDGNRRWAKIRAKQPWLGHGAGRENFKAVTETFFKSGVKFITFWTASLDNLTKRSKTEIGFLKKYLYQELKNKDSIAKFLREGIRVRVVGQWGEVFTDSALQSAIQNIEQITAKCERHQLTILFGYDGKSEMLHAVKQAIGVKEKVDESFLRKNLWTGFLPDVDLVIRTGGEPHWSAGFLMWLTANSQFYFTEKLWPDFSKQDVKLALEDYARRQRRLGS